MIHAGENAGDLTPLIAGRNIFMRTNHRHWRLKDIEDEKGGMSNFNNMMPMIASTNLSMLRNLEHFQVMSDVLTYLKSEDPEELKLASVAESFETKLKAYDGVLVLERGNVLSAKISQADTERDNALKALIAILKAYSFYPEKAKADAAQNLLHIIGKYSSTIDRLPYLQ